MAERQFTEGYPQRSLSDGINATPRNFDPLRIDCPKYPVYTDVATRICSFEDWTSSMMQNTRDFALAGFFNAGRGDNTRCFHCGVGLADWRSVDDPWIEHARQFPRCAFLRQTKGDEFIAEVQIRHPEEDVLTAIESTENIPGSQRNENTATERESTNDIYNFSSVQSVLEMGYSRQVVREAVDQLRLVEHIKDISGTDLIEIVLSNEENRKPLEIPPPFNNTAHQTGLHTKYETNPAVNGRNIDMISIGRTISVSPTNCSDGNPEIRLLILTEENKRLKDFRPCKICLANDASIAMLPCGHLFSCPDCVPAKRECPICRQLVKGTVRIWMV